MKSESEKREAAKNFVEYWIQKGGEKQDTQKFWSMLLRDILDVYAPERTIDFEKRVKIGNTKYIDAYLADTKIAIEQKSSYIDLDKAEKQSDGSELTPFEQLKRYDDNLPFSEKSRWLIVCNFREFRIYDTQLCTFQTVLLKDLSKEYYRLQFLIDEKIETIRREEEISKAAGTLVGKLYDAFYGEYVPPKNAKATQGNPRGLSESQLSSLNILCVRLVFCLYANTAGLFETRFSFVNYLKSFNLPNVRNGLINLFKALDTPLEERDEYDESIKPFPYVNGGLFKDTSVTIPHLTKEILDLIIDECAVFNWSEISPTIFGAVFESTLNPDTRHKGGMHYTSIENIHKVIDPLFMDSLTAELSKIKSIVSLRERRLAVKEFQDKISSLKFLDPACGSGNFLTESYLSLAKLEIEALKATKDTNDMFVTGQAKVDISQFYGIEINDYAVTVAKTALWIAESQVAELVNEILQDKKVLFPLTTTANIVENNALRLDWATLKPIDDSAVIEGLFALSTTEVDGSVINYNYVMGNPPYLGYSQMKNDSIQKIDMKRIFNGVKSAGILDYVSSWYQKAAELIKDTDIKAAFVSTSSITQGEQVAVLWKHLFNQGIQIDFAYRTFKWDNRHDDPNKENPYIDKNMAQVHCVVIGFSYGQNDSVKYIYNDDGSIETASHINGYLLPMEDIFIENRKMPLGNVSEMVYGNKPTDGGYLFLTAEERKEFLKKEPKSRKYIKQILGAKEYINKQLRYCLWLVNADPAKLIHMPMIMDRVEKVRTFRLKSEKEATRKSASYPTLFQEIRQPNSNYLIIPRVSSERRKYVPIGFISPKIIVNDSVQIIPNATLFEFGVLTSIVHMAWMRVVCGRLEIDYRYSKEIVYNNFPWCTPTDEQKKKIEASAHAILDARAQYPTVSLADLYGEKMYMFPLLENAHKDNDRAVLEAYGFDMSTFPSEEDMLTTLFRLYAKTQQQS